MVSIFLYLALISRYYLLGLKPPHHDETINGWFVSQIWSNGFFQYDPSNYHGPLFFYFLQLAELFGGARVESYRFIAVSFSVLTILWIAQWVKLRLSLSILWLAPLLLSTGFLFFSRSAIHESMFVFFLIILATSLIDIFIFKDSRWHFFYIALFGLITTKETFIISFLSAFLTTALLFLFWYRRTVDKSNLKFLLFKIKQGLKQNNTLIIVLLFLWLGLYTSWWTKPEGILNFFKTFLPWMKTGVDGSGHEKPFLYFYELLFTYEKATWFALVISFAAIFHKKKWIKLVSLWAIVNFLLYSLITYKTPWCLISIQLPIWLSCFCFVSQLGFWLRSVAVVALYIFSFLNFSEFIDLNYKNPTQNHPYVYVQTAQSAKTFINNLIDQAEKNPDLYQSSIQIGTFESWPFPWWLQTFKNQHSKFISETIDDNDLSLNQDIYFVEKTSSNKIENKLQDIYLRGEVFVREFREPIYFYLRKSKFVCPILDCIEVSK